MVYRGGVDVALMIARTLTIWEITRTLNGLGCEICWIQMGVVLL